MEFQQALRAFQKNHPFAALDIEGYTFRYLLCGDPQAARTLCYFVGGTGNPLGWFGHVTAMEARYRILLVDYPMGADRMDQQIRLLERLLDRLRIQKAVLIGASLGGYVAQLLAREIPDKVDALVLYATTALTEKGIRDLEKQYRYVGKLLWLMEHIPYGFLKAVTMKPMLRRMIPKDDPDQAQYLRGFADWIYEDYTLEKDLHMTRLMADLIHVKPFVPEDLGFLKGRSLLILPENDKAFTKEMQQDLIKLLPGPQVEFSSGGHLDTLSKAPQFSAFTDAFLRTLP